jgi:hypothetical protein
MSAKVTQYIGVLLSVATACCAAAPRSTAPSVLSETACETLIARNPEAFADHLFRSDYLYTCRLAEAFDEFVRDRQACTQDTDCVFVAGGCRVAGAWVNRKYEG